MNEILNYFYLLGYAVAFTGLARQTFYMYRNKDAKSFTMVYAFSLIIAKLFAFPRAITATYWVWWVQEGIATALTTAFFIAIVLYRKRGDIGK